MASTEHPIRSYLHRGVVAFSCGVLAGSSFAAHGAIETEVVSQARRQCKRIELRSVREVIPNEGDLTVFEINITRLRRSDLFTHMLGKLPSTATVALSVLKECGVELEDFERIVAAARQPMDEGYIVAIRGKGLGLDSTLECINHRAEDWLELVPWHRVVDRCGSHWEVAESDVTIIPVDTNTIVFTSKSLRPSVEQRITGERGSVFEDEMEWVRQEVDLESTAWVGAPATPGSIPELNGAPLVVEHVSISAHTGAGISLVFGARFDTKEHAAAVQKEMSELLLPQARHALTMMGLPARVGDSLAVSRSGKVLRVRASLRVEDVIALVEAMSSQSPSGPRP